MSQGSGQKGSKACCTPDSGNAASVKRAPDAVTGMGTRVMSEVETAERIDFADHGATSNMIRIDDGSFRMGTDSPKAWEADGEGPVREIMLRPFYIDVAAVTNQQFKAFIAATGYRTDAEKFGWSFVFFNHLARKAVDRLARERAVVGLEWWIAVPGTRWDRPTGERSGLKGKMDHPVTHVSWNDTVAYCRWAGKRLPSEAEWECAARGGLEQALYPWGDELTPRRVHRCNIWQGKFPSHDTGEDGYTSTCPVDAFGANGFGLYNCAGNVWEWTNDWFCPSFHVPELPETRDNPRGPEDGTRKVQKGGSFLCHRSYCNRYRVAARISNTPDSSAANAGFRCVRDIK